ncbi:hypothetical protein R6867_13270, partial [Mycobacterium tuberculosis]
MSGLAPVMSGECAANILGTFLLFKSYDSQQAVVGDVVIRRVMKKKKDINKKFKFSWKKTKIEYN